MKYCQLKLVDLYKIRYLHIYLYKNIIYEHTHTEPTNKGASEEGVLQVITMISDTVSSNWILFCILSKNFIDLYQYVYTSLPILIWSTYVKTYNDVV